MKLFNADQVRAWDQFTMNEQSITSEELMERAALGCTGWITKNFIADLPIILLCGTGNNGGDGLAIARLLHAGSKKIFVYIIGDTEKSSPDFKINLAKLPVKLYKNASSIQDVGDIANNAVIIDAIFGSGLNRAAEGFHAEFIQYINSLHGTVISIDVPSGLYIDKTSVGADIIKASHTLSFGSAKPAFLMPENEEYLGEFHIIDIGLSKEFEEQTVSDWEWVDEAYIKKIFKPRKNFAHKGSYGHALLIAGSYGKIGAAVLAARGCLRAGVGLLTMHIPSCGYDIVQTSVPAAMTLTDFNSSYCTRLDDDLSRYNVLGIGPGLGTASETRSCVFEVIKKNKHPMVIDADALNIIATSPSSISTIAHQSILTPHPKEFERMFGKSPNDFKRIQLAIDQAHRYSLIIVLKGHYTTIVLPSGKCYFNSTGNAGMATGGMGDVLTGIITSLLAQHYSPVESAIFGVFIHGLAGDHAAAEVGQESLSPEDLIEKLPSAWQQVAKN